MTKIQAETFVLDDIAQGRIDDKKLFAFLDAYGLYWHYCHAKGRMDEHVLKNAERNAIAYAKNKELCLEFGEMTYSLKTADQVNLESSCYAPSYLDLSRIVEEAIGLIDKLKACDSHHGGVSHWLERSRKFLEGSRRMWPAQEIRSCLVTI